MFRIKALLLLLIFFVSCSGLSYETYNAGSFIKVLGNDFTFLKPAVSKNRGYSPEKLLRSAIENYKNKRYATALNELKVVVNEAASLKTKINALMYLGYCYRIKKQLKRSTKCFFLAESEWQHNYMQGGIVDKKKYSTGVLSRIYKDICRNFQIMGMPVAAAVYLWASQRKNEITDSTNKVSEVNKYIKLGVNISHAVFHLLFDKLNRQTKAHTTRFFRKVIEGDAHFRSFIKRAGIKEKVFSKPRFKDEIEKGDKDYQSTRNVYQAFYRNGILVGLIYHSDSPIIKQKYVYKKGRLVSSQVELHTFVTKELRIKYNKYGRIEYLVLIQERTQQPFYKFLPVIKIYKFN